VREALALTARPEVISFAAGLPAPELFDGEGLRASYDHVLATEPHRVLQYAASTGDPALRGIVGARLAAGGLDADPGRILITTGAQQALALVSIAMLEPGDVVLVEEPTYVAALDCFAHVDARAVPVPTDDHGMVTDALDDLVCEHRPKMVYLVPNFQNPAGHTLPAERRETVAAVAAERGLWVVEDDPYGDLRYRGEPVPWIASLPDAADRTVLLGSFSKILAPGLRLGWMHAPPTVYAACLAAKQVLDLHTSTLDQAAAAHYLAQGRLDSRLDLLRTAYGERCDTLLRALPDALPEGSTWTVPEGGMFVWVRLPEGYDATALLPQAVAHDVAYVPGTPFFAGVPDPGTLRLSFTTNTPADIAEGVRRLAEVLRPQSGGG
jgi:DNA-binding transcriptional MocR family regulator